ncbi:hypothetical protein [Mobiluncus curtisii]|uniref:Uncharacterized protein n=1 Tax=Mobiluncus holmesii ATCC 35242 TaxID=887899 RepID=E6M659_9ACTO|nr:hypothetical protein [Mobiluncus curtisii]EFL93628.1 hypothetical protein HMPREF0574_1358 [Mobiluncus curtisii subsp. curtisii ATCC 35241]EFU81228.1 hypothetical protein HMPREF0576_1741 [Mobiluncus holmesii ATCC 35242]
MIFSFLNLPDRYRGDAAGTLFSRGGRLDDVSWHLAAFPRRPW